MAKIDREMAEALGVVIVILAIAFYRGRTRQRLVWHMEGKCTRCGFDQDLHERFQDHPFSSNV